MINVRGRWIQAGDKCEGSSMRARKSLAGQNMQDCPVCDRRVWITNGGYIAAHHWQQEDIDRVWKEAT